MHYYIQFKKETEHDDDDDDANYYFLLNKLDSNLLGNVKITINFIISFGVHI